MYPLFRTPNRVIAMLVGWSLFSAGLSALVSGIADVPLGRGLVLFAPTYFLWLLFLIPNYFMCRTLPLDKRAWTMVIGNQLWIMLAMALLWALLGRGYALDS